jgi:hypothetical protein
MSIRKAARKAILVSDRHKAAAPLKIKVLLKPIVD